MTKQFEVFDAQVEKARERLDRLAKEARTTPAPPRLLDEAVEELSNALAELHAAGLELHRQNDELVSAQTETDTERRRYQDLFDFAPDGYLTTDPYGVILEANRAAAILLGMSAGRLVRKPFATCVAQEERKRFRTLIDQGKPAHARQSPAAVGMLHLTLAPGHAASASPAVPRACAPGATLSFFIPSLYKNSQCIFHVCAGGTPPCRPTPAALAAQPHYRLSKSSGCLTRTLAASRLIDRHRVPYTR